MGRVSEGLDIDKAVRDEAKKGAADYKAELANRKRLKRKAVKALEEQLERQAETEDRPDGRRVVERDFAEAMRYRPGDAARLAKEFLRQIEYTQRMQKALGDYLRSTPATRNGTASPAAATGQRVPRAR